MQRLNQRYENRQIDAPGSADDAGIAEVVRLMLREELTGSPPPKNLSMVMDLWRPWVKSRAGELISELGDQLDNQSAFAELSRRLIGALESDLGDSASDEDQDSEMKMIKKIMVTANPSRMARSLPSVKIKVKAMTVSQWMMLAILARPKMAK